MKKNTNVLFLCLPFLFTVYSCMESCNCSKSYGCTKLTATAYSDRKIIESKTFCSVEDFYMDAALEDSTMSFYKRHAADDSQVVEKDSIYSTLVQKNSDKKKPARIKIRAINVFVLSKCFFFIE